MYQPVERLLDSSYTIQDYLRDELRAIARELSDQDAVELRAVGKEPVKPRIGMLAYADGLGWNPGGGAGLYVFKATGWTFVA